MCQGAISSASFTTYAAHAFSMKFMDPFCMSRTRFMQTQLCQPDLMTGWLAGTLN